MHRAVISMVCKEDDTRHDYQINGE